MVAPEPLPQAEYERIYSRVPRLTVEVVVTGGAGEGVLLALRSSGPCRGLWHLPGGTVRYGEPLVEAVHRVARTELGVEVGIDRVLGYVEYPSHLERGIDWPVGIAFATHLATAAPGRFGPDDASVRWFAHLPVSMHDEQRAFLEERDLVR